MKRLFTVLFTMLLQGSSCADLEDCDCEVYRIQSMSTIGNGFCEYKAWANRECFILAKRGTLFFKDTCGVYVVSELVYKQTLKTKYGI